MREIKINEGKEEIEDFLKENLGVGAEVKSVWIRRIRENKNSSIRKLREEKIASESRNIYIEDNLTIKERYKRS